MRQLVHHIADDSARAEVEACLDDFESQALPEFAQLRRQVIHNDLNPGNALVSDADPPEVMGVIDFGDMLRAPLIVDVAIAAAYLRRLSGDAMLPLLGFVAGFHSVVPLEEREIALLYDLVRTRLATTVTILNWRAFARSDDDAYLQKALAESTSDRFLQRVSAISRQEFSDRVSARLAG